jgi:DNA (cytosine-5)-methyltransferase 1
MNVLDLFCGCGGSSQGFLKANYNVLAGIDNWGHAIESYKENHTNSKGVVKDLTKYSPAEFSGDYKIPKGKIDVLIGSPPCQGMSIGGRRDPKDPRNSLFMEYVKYLDFYNPKAFLMENVIGLLSMKNAKGDKMVDIIMSYFDKNYNTKIFKLYASDYGVPQNRRRVIIIGYRKDLNITPSEPVKPNNIKSVSDRPAVKTILLNKSAVDKKYFLSQRAIDGINARREKMKNKKFGFGAQFLNPDKPSYTIPARYWKDGYDALVRYSDNDMRRLTELELRRIQSFPDNYILKGNKKDVVMQIGNAVACDFAYHLAKHIETELS